MGLQLSEVLADPSEAARRVEAASTLWRCTVMVATPSTVVVRLVLRPNPPFDTLGYPVEAAWLILRVDGTTAAVCPEPRGARRWLHRNAGRYTGWPPGSQAGTLCLQYPHDPPELRWTWHDGLEALVQVVHRHLVFEESWRRTGRWPVEDAPHGHGRRPHPILHSSTRRILKELA